MMSGGDEGLAGGDAFLVASARRRASSSSSSSSVSCATRPPSMRTDSPLSLAYSLWRISARSSLFFSSTPSAVAARDAHSASVAVSLDIARRWRSMSDSLSTSIVANAWSSSSRCAPFASSLPTPPASRSSPSSFSCTPASLRRLALRSSLSVSAASRRRRTARWRWTSCSGAMPRRSSSREAGAWPSEPSDISLADPSSSENRLSFMNDSMPTGVGPPGFPSPGRFPDAPGKPRIAFSTAASG
mmetsp:Transcript_1190/g.4855  ORF Transcript_1190/g.4855 Transcript_1190/m.4855 type:complete len:244 (+) Transcript_1190:1561-2292(+)